MFHLPTCFGCVWFLPWQKVAIVNTLLLLVYCLFITTFSTRQSFILLQVNSYILMLPYFNSYKQLTSCYYHTRQVTNQIISIIFRCRKTCESKKQEVTKSQIPSQPPPTIHFTFFSIYDSNYNFCYLLQYI